MQVECRPLVRKGFCHNCQQPLPKGRRSWCSNECERHITHNHVWGVARYEVLRRDNYQCVICGQGDKDEKARAYYKRVGKSILEVNHIRPVNGGRTSVSCHHHLDNLETLCHPCHVAVTKQQYIDGDIVPVNRHLIRFIRLESGFTIYCARCSVVIEKAEWGKMRRTVCPAGTLKSQKAKQNTPLRRPRRKRRVKR